MRPITQEMQREIIQDFAQVIREKKAPTPKPAFAVINFRDDKSQKNQRPIESVPIDSLRYRKDNGRIASDVMNYEKLNGTLDERDKDAQEILRSFLEKKHPEMTGILIKSIEHNGQSEPAIITCDGFLINGNRRKMALESLGKLHPGVEKYKYMDVVILPGPGDTGGPPSLLEVERIENRYQLQSEGKSEYYGFDRALSIKRKMELGFSLEEQLKDDPRYVRATEQELKKAVKECEREYIWPLESVDRYLQQFDREGMYGTISSGVSDREGRWQAFIDYSNALHTSLKNQKWQIENGLDEAEIGTIEEAAFKMIRLRTFSNIDGAAGLPKIHQIMRSLPKMCALKESRKEIFSIANEVDSSVPQDEQFDAEGNALSLDDVDKKWAYRNRQKLIMLTKKALNVVDSSRDKETPLMLLEAALKKLTHEDFSIENIPHPKYHEAGRLAREIQQIARDIEHQLYENEKKLKNLTLKR